jgi:hypothetical protein
MEWHFGGENRGDLVVEFEALRIAAALSGSLTTIRGAVFRGAGGEGP